MFTMLNVVYDHFLTRKPQFFTLFILSRTSDNTTSQNIGGTNAWAVPPSQILGGPSPPVPPRSPPLAGPPPSTCVHLSLTPLRVDVINGWPLSKKYEGPEMLVEKRPQKNKFFDELVHDPVIEETGL